MSKNHLSHWGIVLIAAISNLWLANGVTAETLKVGTKPFPPFVFSDDNNSAPTGYSMELWHKVADRIDGDYELVVFDSLGELLDAVEVGEVDIAIAGISITANREEKFDFSHSYYETGLKILTLNQPETPTQMLLAYVFSWQTIEAAAILFGMALLSAHIIWIFERRKNPEMFPTSYLQGIWESFWWSLVTATTVGYGDKSPKGFVGRLIAISWMIGAIFLFAHFTAAVTANRLEANISSMEDLYGSRVAAVRDTTAEDYLRTHPVKLVSYSNRKTAYQALKNGRVQAVVDDAPTLLYLANQDPDFRVVGNLFAKQNYGIALPQDSSYLELINRTLLQLKEAGEIDDLDQKWFSSGY